MLHEKNIFNFKINEKQSWWQNAANPQTKFYNMNSRILKEYYFLLKICISKNIFLLFNAISFKEIAHACPVHYIYIHGIVLNGVNLWSNFSQLLWDKFGSFYEILICQYPIMEYLTTKIDQSQSSSFETQYNAAM